MKRYFFIGVLLAVFSAVYLQAQPAGTGSKVAVIDTAAFFDERSGITRILTASKNLNTELSARRNDLQVMLAKVQVLEKEVTTFRNNVAKGIPIDEKVAQAKSEEFERLRLEGKYKGDEFNALAQKRQTQVVGPEYSAALKALGEYSRSKGYGIVFDLAKDQNGLLVFATEQYDITKDFITFYNTRPPTAINSVPKQ